MQPHAHNGNFCKSFYGMQGMAIRFEDHFQPQYIYEKNETNYHETR